jgi:tetratricopeptide (TPR) repeat protein
VLCGAIVCRAGGRSPDPTTADPPARTTRWSTAGAGMLAVAMLGGLLWSGEQFRRGWIVQEAVSATPIVDDEQTRADVAALDAAIALQQRAADAAPDDAAAWLHLSDLWSARYTRAFRRKLAETVVDPIFWQWESPTQLHAVAILLARTLDEPALAALRTNPLVAENLKPALAAARKARDLRPLSAWAQLVTARLCFLDERPQNDGFYLDRAEQLARGYDDWLYDIGVLHLNAGRVDRALAVWQRSWQLSDRFDVPILSLASGFFTPQQLLKRLVPADPVTIVRVADIVFGQPERSDDRKVFYARAAELLQQLDTPTAGQYELLGRVELGLGRLPEATRRFEEAVALDPRHAEWFLELATAYERMGNRQKALAHARSCVELAPHVGNYREVLVRLEAAATGSK